MSATKIHATSESFIAAMNAALANIHAPAISDNLGRNLFYANKSVAHGLLALGYGPSERQRREVAQMSAQARNVRFRAVRGMP